MRGQTRKRRGWYYIFSGQEAYRLADSFTLKERMVQMNTKSLLRQAIRLLTGRIREHGLIPLQDRIGFLHFQDVYAAGRIVHLQPMHWENDWPIIGVNKTGNDYGGTCYGI